jgi:hypothetical protein
MIGLGFGLGFGFRELQFASCFVAQTTTEYRLCMEIGKILRRHLY